MTTLNKTQVATLIQQDNTVSSIELHKVVHATTNNFKELKEFHAKVRKVLGVTKGRAKMTQPIYHPNGTVASYDLSQVEVTMVLAATSLEVLRVISEVYVHVHNHMQAEYNASVAKVNGLKSDIQDLKVINAQVVDDRNVLVQDIIATSALVEVYPKSGFMRSSQLQTHFYNDFTKVGTKHILKDSACLLWIDTCECVRVVEKYGVKHAVNYTAYKVSDVTTVIGGLIRTAVHHTNKKGGQLRRCSSPLVTWDFNL